MDSSASTKTKLIKWLEKKYGPYWKSRLSEELEVNISTIKRNFNQKDKLSVILEKAVLQLLSDQ